MRDHESQVTSSKQVAVTQADSEVGLSCLEHWDLFAIWCLGFPVLRCASNDYTR